jgi:hypothetical protein
MARFDSLPYPIHKLAPGESVDQCCAKLFKLKEFQKIRARADYNRLVKYIVYLYDEHSELAHENKDLQARKDAAATQAGYERVLTSKKADNEGKWPKHLQDVMSIKDADTHAAIMAYFRLHRNEIWREINVCEQELDEFQSLRFASIGGKKGEEKDTIKAATEKDKLKDACDLRLKSLVTLRKQFYEDHTDVQKAEFTEAITPETAERILTDKPYEEVDTEEEALKAVSDVQAD